jgi:membrane peptidoglycan carboxypeptidase
MGIETIQNEQTKVVIDTNSKLVMVYNTIPMANSPGIEIISALKLCSSIRVNDKGTKSTIELDFQDNQYPLSKMVIAIVDHRLTVLEMWHNEAVTDDNGEIIKPRTKVSYTDYQENKKFSAKEFAIGHIVELKNSVITPKAEFSLYRIMDLRTN